MTKQKQQKQSPNGGGSAECPICLEEMPDTYDNSGKVRMACCGNFYCLSCWNDCIRRGSDINDQLESLLLHDSDENDREIDRLETELKILAKCPLCRQEEPTSEEELFQYNLRRAKMGNKEAQYDLAGMYGRGEGTQKDDAKAAIWIKAAAEQGFVLAMYSYGLCLKFGQGCPQSESEAFDWLKKAADAGCTRAESFLGSYYIDGEVVERDVGEGVRLLKLGSDRGCNAAQMDLAACHILGVGVEKDADEAMRLYKMAAEDGHAGAQYKLGDRYMDSGDIEQGLYWLVKSADQCFPEAIQALCTLVDRHDKIILNQNDSNSGKASFLSTMKKMKQSAANGDKNAMRSVAVVEKCFSAKCANCKKGKPVGVNLLRCSKCKLMRYCSKVCQVNHWKVGHKNDCCAQD